MPQWRKLHAKITESEDVNEMPDDFTRFTWTLMPVALDSEGRAQDDASLIRSKLHPKRRDVSLEMIEAALFWYAERGMIIRYEVNGRRYFQVPTFKFYQGKTDREAASVIPEPTARKRRPTPTTHPVDPKSQSGPTHDLVQTGSTLDVDSDAEEIRVENPAAKTGRRADPVFDAIVEVCAIDTTIQGSGASVVGRGTPTWVRKMLGYNPSIAEYRACMGIEWMNRDELSQAIPPAYCEFIGRRLMHALDAAVMPKEMPR